MGDVSASGMWRATLSTAEARQIADDAQRQPLDQLLAGVSGNGGTS